MIPYEVKIYYEKVVKFINENKEAYTYFSSNVNVEEFYDAILKEALNNYEITGDPTLERNQFEGIIRKLKLEQINDYFGDFSLN